MTYVVTLACELCKYTDCVDVCPTDAFHEGPDMLVINPRDCIDCAVCVTECPVQAIVADEDLPIDLRQILLELNRENAAIWPVIVKSRASQTPRPADHPKATGEQH